MIKLSEYIVDTQGVLPPELVMNNRRCYSPRTGKTIVLNGLQSYHFSDIDGRMEKYRFIRIPNKPHYIIDDLFILEDKVERLLYE